VGIVCLVVVIVLDEGKSLFKFERRLKATKLALKIDHQLTNLITSISGKSEKVIVSVA
jgi:hypothetical protein